MDRSKAEQLIVQIASFNGLDPDLAIAVAEVESHFDEYAVRFEPNWKYVFDVDIFAKRCRITADTERVLQSMSWGMMQVMGTVARELGHKNSLLELVRPETGVIYGVLKLKSLWSRFTADNKTILDDVISSYNQGSPRKTADGRYYNQIYVNKVREIYFRLKNDRLNEQPQ